jgi:hypothetical protein
MIFKAQYILILGHNYTSKSQYAYISCTNNVLASLSQFICSKQF